MTSDQAGLALLTRPECLARLSTVPIGRVGFHAGALPVVMPVAFAVDRDAVVFATRAGTPLAGALDDAVVAFEADDFDPAHGRGWSVSATGIASRVVDAAELVRIAGLAPGGLDGGGEARLFRVSLEVVSGREGGVVVTGSEPAGAAGEGRGQPGVAGPPAVAETHSGIVFFVGDRAYKMKKAVDFGFLDFRTRDARREACRREVALNRRLAPDVYLGVADLTGPDGDVCEHFVVMQRMPEDRRLAALVTAGVPVESELERVAAVLARFHARAETSAEVEQAASADSQRLRWERNAEEMAPFTGGILDGAVAADVARMAARYLDGRRRLFDARVRQGRARDGHGDLLADDVFCLADGPRLLDCLEFDDRLRAGDTLADAAFLAMDLERLGRADLAELFLEAYRTAAGDDWPPSLADHHVAYRAQVRAKVACLRWSQGDAAMAATADRLLRICHARLRRAEVRLVLVGGLPGTGKTTLARGLAGPLRARVIRSDEVRKRLAGIDPATPAPAAVGEGLYGSDLDDATYEAMLYQAGEELAMGHSVVLDATWRHPEWRARAEQVAGDAISGLVALRCVAPTATASERAARRSAEGGDASDASAAVVRALAGREPAWPGARAIDTSGPPGEVLAEALAAAGLPPAAGGPGPSAGPAQG